eukprot:scaffold63_cov306-Pinguiococcus_pyrenoidosus.AAC.30
MFTPRASSIDTAASMFARLETKRNQEQMPLAYLLAHERAMHAFHLPDSFLCDWVWIVASPANVQYLVTE